MFPGKGMRRKWLLVDLAAAILPRRLPSRLGQVSASLLLAWQAFRQRQVGLPHQASLLQPRRSSRRLQTPSPTLQVVFHRPEAGHNLARRGGSPPLDPIFRRPVVRAPPTLFRHPARPHRSFHHPVGKEPRHLARHPPRGRMFHCPACQRLRQVFRRLVVPRHLEDQAAHHPAALAMRQDKASRPAVRHRALRRQVARHQRRSAAGAPSCC